MGEPEVPDPFVGVVTAAHVYGAVVDVGRQVVQVDHKVDLVEKQIAQVDGKVDGVVATVTDLQTRVRDLEANRWPKSLPTMIAALALLVAVIGLWKAMA